MSHDKQRCLDVATLPESCNNDGNSLVWHITYTAVIL